MSGINTRILLHEFGSYNKCPDELHARIEAIESHFMTEVCYSLVHHFSSKTHNAC